MNTRKMFARGVSGTARLVYDRCCGAFLLFAAVTVAMLALQHANGAMGDVIPWPKGIQACVMFVLWANIGVAMVVSLFRRKWARAFGQLLLVAVAFVGLVFVGFVSFCVPTRMTSAPSAEWTQKCICDIAQVECSRLVFRGGISTREEVVVFEVADGAAIGAGFRQGSPLGEGASVREHFQALFEYCRIAIELPTELDISSCNGVDGNLHKIVASGKTYLVYERF